MTNSSSFKNTESVVPLLLIDLNMNHFKETKSEID